MIASLEKKLAQRNVWGNCRFLKKERALIDFASNDYLGLSRSPILRERIKTEWEMLSLGNGSTGSRLLTGNSGYAETLEEEIAQFHECEASLLFGCGYLANISLLHAVASVEDSLFFDMGSHASIWDGVALSRAAAFPFRHNDLNHLEDRLKSAGDRGNRFICAASVYSTDGSRAPLKELFALANRYHAHLIIDEAHAVGVLGPEGKGLLANEGLSGKVFAQLVAFGKALGCYGAAILGSSLLKRYLINFAHGCVYTTFMPPMLLAAIRSSYALFPSFYQERAQLQKLIWNCCEKLGAASHTPIQSIRIPGNREVKQAAERFIQEGFDVRPLLSPTVRRGEERLRLIIHAYNTQEELTRCLALL